MPLQLSPLKNLLGNKNHEWIISDDNPFYAHQPVTDKYERTTTNRSLLSEVYSYIALDC